jgi:hypothetical protein
MMGTREKLRGGWEFDALTRGRRMSRWKAGKAARWKRQFWKRVRRRKREELATQSDPTVGADAVDAEAE